MSNRFAPDHIPKFSDMLRGCDDRVIGAFTELEGFLYSLAFSLVQGQDAMQSPTVARGDMIYRPQDGPGLPDTRLPIGDDGQFLGIDGGIPEWQDLPADTIEQVTQEGIGVPVADDEMARLLRALLMELEGVNAAIVVLKEKLAELGAAVGV